jgi:hypothetical protein
LGQGCASPLRSAGQARPPTPEGISNDRFVSQLVDDIQMTNLLNEMSPEAQAFILKELGISADELVRVRAFVIPKILMQSMVIADGEEKTTEAFFFLHRDHLTDDTSRWLAKTRKLNVGEFTKLMSGLKGKLFGSGKYAILLYADKPPSNPQERSIQDSRVVHEVYHYYQYVHHNLPVYVRNADTVNSVEGEAYAFGMRYLATKGFTFEQVTASFCKTSDLSAQEARQELKAFERSAHGKFLAKVWKEQVEPRLTSKLGPEL